MAMKEENVIEHLSKYGIKGKLGSSIWTMPTSLTGGLNYINVNFSYQVLNFADEQIAIIGINQATNKIVDDMPGVIPMNMVTEVSFKKGFLFNKMTIYTSEGSLGYKVMKNIMNKKWHKINYESLVLRFQNK